MKNIHILPTDKPSRFFIYNGELGLAKEYQYGSDAIQNQNIYITSNEEIKEGDWFLCLDNGKCNDSIYKANEVWINMEEKQPSYCKKIILVKDQDLIKDGVQTINDEFLEWFVKNPSCEEVEIETFEVEDYVGFAGHTGYPTFHNEYKIIIPKEEPKQETLEEAKIKHTKFCIENNIENPSFSFDKGAKWQQERSYSEEEVELLLETLSKVLVYQGNDYRLPHYFEFEIQQVIEQFKKK